LDEAQAREAKQRAEEALADKQSDMDYATAQARLVEAAAQLRMLEDIRRRRR
jgi:F-type H+-transporting ATPase subunit epsilon